MTLKDLEIGTSGVIIAVGGEGSLRQHFLDMGSYPWGGSYIDEVCSHGRPNGAENPWL